MNDRIKYFLEAWEMNGVGKTIATVQDSPGTVVTITVDDLRALLAAGASEGQAEPVAWMTEGNYPSPRFIIGNTDPSGVWKEQYVPLYLHPSAEITAPNPDEEFCKAYAEEWQDTLKEQSDCIKARDAEIAALRERIAGMEKDAPVTVKAIDLISQAIYSGKTNEAYKRLDDIRAVLIAKEKQQ